MNKNVKKFFVAAAAVVMGGAMVAMSGCDMLGSLTGGEKECEHTFLEHKKVEATCVADGKLAYQECIECHKFFIGGVEKTEAELVIAKDTSAHKNNNAAEVPANCTETGVKAHYKCNVCNKVYVNGVETTLEGLKIPVDASAHVLTKIAEQTVTCTTDGIAAHDECGVCGKWFVNGAETTKAAITTKASGTHTFAEGSNVCAAGDGYKTTVNGKEYVVDASNAVEIVAQKDGVHGPSDALKEQYLTALLANKLTFATQTPSSKATATCADGEVTYTNENMTKAQAAFTRFAAEEGRYVLVYDVTFSADTEVSRLGAKVAQVSGSDANDGAYTNSPLKGSNVDKGADGEVLSVKAGTTYRFEYVVEITAADQIIQLYYEIAGGITVTMSNLHLFAANEDATTTPGATFVSFGAIA